ncbi:MAG: hypothetical protein VKL97_05535 [Cyanobacteriota bacterium]|nr:hypothetical protein [Cyanobacteriota bacterium]
MALRPSAVAHGAAADGSGLGLYDHSGMLRFIGAGEADCLAYAQLFELAANSFSLAPLGPADASPALPGDCSN